MARTPEYYREQSKKMLELARQAETEQATRIGQVILKHWPEYKAAEEEVKAILGTGADTKTKPKPEPKAQAGQPMPQAEVKQAETKPEAKVEPKPAEKKGWL